MMLNTFRHKPIAYKHDFLTKIGPNHQEQEHKKYTFVLIEFSKEVVITCDLMLETCFDRHKEPESTNDFT